MAFIMFNIKVSIAHNHIADFGREAIDFISFMAELMRHNHHAATIGADSNDCLLYTSPSPRDS